MNVFESCAISGKRTAETVIVYRNKTYVVTVKEHPEIFHPTDNASHYEVTVAGDGMENKFGKMDETELIHWLQFRNIKIDGWAPVPKKKSDEEDPGMPLWEILNEDEAAEKIANHECWQVAPRKYNGYNLYLFDRETDKFTIYTSTESQDVINATLEDEGIGLDGWHAV